MIQTKADLKRYIQQDMLQNHVAYGGGVWAGCGFMPTPAYGLPITYVITNIITIGNKIRGTEFFAFSIISSISI